MGSFGEGVGFRVDPGLIEEGNHVLILLMNRSEHPINALKDERALPP